MKRMFYRLNASAGGILLAVGLVLAGSAVAFDINSTDKTNHPTINVPMDENSVSRDSLPHGSYAPVIKKVSPAVVKIVTTSKIENSSTDQMPGLDDPFWRRFFGEQFGGRNMPRSPQIQHGLGSG